MAILAMFEKSLLEFCSARKLLEFFLLEVLFWSKMIGSKCSSNWNFCSLTTLLGGWDLFLQKSFFSGRGSRFFEVGGSNSKILTGGITKIKLGGWDLFAKSKKFSTWESKMFEQGGQRWARGGEVGGGSPSRDYDPPYTVDQTLAKFFSTFWDYGLKR